MNNAGVAYICHITEEPSTEQLAKVLQTNILGPYYMVHCVLPHMPRGGRIINISSTNSKRGNVNIAPYAASKAALDSLTWSWAGEVGFSQSSFIMKTPPLSLSLSLFC